MAVYHLHRWSIARILSQDSYKLPEAATARLSGFRDQESKKIVTSVIIEANGREIITYSGSVYILEDIDPDYLKFLDDIGDTYDPENPVKIKNI